MIQFEVGKKYGVRSACDYTCIFSFKVVRRTAKNLWVAEDCQPAKTKRVKIHVQDGVEYVWPNGRYSMAPILRANRETSNMAVAG